MPLDEEANGSVRTGLWARLRRQDPQARPKRTPVRRTRPSRTVPSETKIGGNLVPARTTAWACSCPWKCAIAWLVSRSASSLRVGDKAPFAAARVSASFAARFLFFVAFRWRESGALRYLGTAPRLVPSDVPETRLSPSEPPVDVLLRFPRGFRLVRAWCFLPRLRLSEVLPCEPGPANAPFLGGAPPRR